MLQRIYGTAWFSQKDLDALPRAHRGGREARPPQARQGTRPVQLPRGRRRRAADLPPQGRARPAADAGVAARRALRPRLRRGHHAAHLQDRRLEDQRALRLLRREHVLLRDRRGRRPRQRVRRQADELPRPRADLRQRRALVPRPADAHLRVRHGVPPRDSRASCTASCARAASRRTTRTSSAPPSRCTTRSSACSTSSTT